MLIDKTILHPVETQPDTSGILQQACSAVRDAEPEGKLVGSCRSLGNLVLVSYSSLSLHPPCLSLSRSPPTKPVHNARHNLSSRIRSPLARLGADHDYLSWRHNSIHRLLKCSAWRRLPRIHICWMLQRNNRHSGCGRRARSRQRTNGT